MPANEKAIYLTFDDGPTPGITEWVLDTLDEFNAAATFFCVGENARKFPDLLKRISSKHSIGNHTMHHLNGWKSSDDEYENDVRECAREVRSGLFRPPYGKIKRSQVTRLEHDYRIIMWDVLSKDYDRSLMGDDCFRRIVARSRNGSIIVFHDSIKAEARLRYVLPATLRYFSGRGFRFRSIPAG
jgi:peptidoglycan/xylan/chitin deacetylase (PgdA/CDA1 family)